ncbi:MAG TPA: FAD:protein FMN transferase, partial [Vicinamibacteria bacterium]
MPVPAEPESWSRRDLLALASPRAASADHWVRASRTAMACRFEVLLSGEHASFLGAAQEALAAADRVEDRLTVFRDSSEVARVNARAAQAAVAVSEELFALLETAARLHARTGGAFDPTATPLSRTWG